MSVLQVKVNNHERPPQGVRGHVVGQREKKCGAWQDAVSAVGVESKLKHNHDVGQVSYNVSFLGTS